MTAAADEPEGRASTDHACLVARLALGDLTAEEGMMLDAFLPEVLARVARVEVELDCILVVTLQQRNSATVTTTRTVMTSQQPEQLRVASRKQSSSQ